MPSWLWTGTAAAWASTVVGAVAVYFALQTWRASVSAIRSSYRPVVRPVAVEPRHIPEEKLILKNYGRGPALAVVILDEPTSYWHGSIDVLEVLGPREGVNETTRIGRELVSLHRAMEHGKTYRILYQDLGGRWHETTFRFFAPDDARPAVDRVRYLGTRRSGRWRGQIPLAVTSYFANVYSTED